jgi:nicotinamidase-related amidase
MMSSFDKDGKDLTRGLQALNRLARQQVGDDVTPHKDHPGSKIIDLLKPEERDLVVIKNTSSVFTSTKLELILKNMGIEQLFVTGVVTNMCVEGAARTASEYGFDVFLIDDACAAWSPEIHVHTLQSFALLFGFVMTTDETLAVLQEKIEKK